MDKVRFGIIGVGGMGANHLQSLKQCRHAVLTAVCDTNRECADRVASENQVKAFYDANAMYESGAIDAVLIVTPHFSHTPLTIAAFERKIHVLCDKPVAAQKADALKMLAAQEKQPGMKFGVMYQLRTSQLFKKVKQLIDNGALGEIFRVNWTATHWFRTQAYYNSGTWRATWKGEGGGVLMNQCPHQLDLFQWWFGMPETVRAFGALGKYHKIEVEDDVTAYFTYANGASAVFIATTGEYPGTDRVEIAADNGTLIIEDGKLRFNRSETPVGKYTAATSETLGTPGMWKCEIPVASTAITATEVIDAFAESVIDPVKEPMVTGREGMNTVELINAMHCSMLKNEMVKFPLDAAASQRLLDEMIGKFAAKQ